MSRDRNANYANFTKQVSDLNELMVIDLNGEGEREKEREKEREEGAGLMESIQFIKSTLCAVGSVRIGGVRWTN